MCGTPEDRRYLKLLVISNDNLKCSKDPITGEEIGRTGPTLQTCNLCPRLRSGLSPPPFLTRSNPDSEPRLLTDPFLCFQGFRTRKGKKEISRMTLCHCKELHHMHFMTIFTEITFKKYLIGGKYHQLTGLRTVKINNAAKG